MSFRMFDKAVVFVGNSQFVGRPMARLLDRITYDFSSVYDWQFICTAYGHS
jgi:5,10-methylene-tetrahydrofolate dehydrogenase/methenyl tetrahydrofolate cyclohydrolase